MPITAANPFKWRHDPGDIIMWCVRWYLRHPISAAQMAEMTVERGLSISASYVLAVGPDLRAGIGQALSASLEADRQELAP